MLVISFKWLINPNEFKNMFGQSLAAICHPHMELNLNWFENQIWNRLKYVDILASGKLSKNDILVAASSVPYKYLCN